MRSRHEVRCLPQMHHSTPRLHNTVRQVFYKTLLKRILCASSTILDAGCGFGEFSMVANSFGRMIVSADVDPEMVSYCKGNTPNPVLCSIEFLPFRSTAFDAIFNSHVLEHLMGVERVLSEFIRVLKDGGTLVVLIPTKHRDFYRERGHIRGYDEARLVSDLNVAGFKTVQVFYDKFYVLGMGKIKLGIERIAIRFLNALPILWMKCNLLAIATKT